MICRHSAWSARNWLILSVKWQKSVYNEEITATTGQPSMYDIISSCNTLCCHPTKLNIQSLARSQLNCVLPVGCVSRTRISSGHPTLEYWTIFSHNNNFYNPNNDFTDHWDTLWHASAPSSPSPHWLVTQPATWSNLEASTRPADLQMDWPDLEGQQPWSRSVANVTQRRYDPGWYALNGQVVHTYVLLSQSSITWY